MQLLKIFFLTFCISSLFISCELKDSKTTTKEEVKKEQPKANIIKQDIIKNGMWGAIVSKPLDTETKEDKGVYSKFYVSRDFNTSVEDTVYMLQKQHNDLAWRRRNGQIILVKYKKGIEGYLKVFDYRIEDETKYELNQKLK